MIYIFGKKMCSACQKAKQSFEADGIDFQYIDLDDMTRDQMAFAALHGAMTEGVVLPIIVSDDTIINAGQNTK